MVIYTKIIDYDTLNKTHVVYYQIKCAKDIIENVLAGNVKVENKEYYDELYKSYISNTILFDKYMTEIEIEHIGKDIIIPDSVLYISPQRGKIILRIHNTKNVDIDEIESYLINKRGFVKVEISE